MAMNDYSYAVPSLGAIALDKGDISAVIGALTLTESDISELKRVTINALEHGRNGFFDAVKTLSLLNDYDYKS